MNDGPSRAELRRRVKQRSTFAFRVLVIPLKGLLNVLVRRHWRGGEHLPATGCVIVANHMTNIDPLTVGHFLWNNGCPPCYMAKASLFRIPGIGWAARKTEQIPVDREKAPAKALRPAVKAAAEGRCVVLFPEGTLTADPSLWPIAGKTGAVRIALEADVPLIPVAHWGAQNVLPQRAKFFKLGRRKDVWTVAGPPIDLADLRGRDHVDGATLREATKRAMATITAMLEEIRGEKAPDGVWDPHKGERV